MALDPVDTKIESWVKNNPSKVRQFIRDLEQQEGAQAKAIYDTNMVTAQNWYDSQKIDISKAATRTEALDNFHLIEQMLRTEADNYKASILRQKLDEANKKFKERKANG